MCVCVCVSVIKKRRFISPELNSLPFIPIKMKRPRRVKMKAETLQHHRLYNASGNNRLSSRVKWQQTSACVWPSNTASPTESGQISVTPQIGHRSVLLFHLIGIICGVLRKRCFLETSGPAVLIGWWWEDLREEARAVGQRVRAEVDKLT